MKKLCTFLAILMLPVLCILLYTTEAHAAGTVDIVDSGYCGADYLADYQNVTWKFDTEGTLTISGTGSMEGFYFNISAWGDYYIWDDYDEQLGAYGYWDYAPWHLYINFIKSVVIEEGVTTIGVRAFYDCVNMTSITIPSSITAIGDAAFDDCINLQNVYVTDIAAWCNINFSDFDSNPMTHAERLYLNGKPLTYLEIPDGVTRVRDFAFYSCEGITSATIPESVVDIGERAFGACANLERIEVAANNLDYSCDNQGVLYDKKKTVLLQAPGMITSCVVPEGVTHIKSYAFRSCVDLRTVTIPKSVTNIENYAFNYCHSLRGVYISDLSAWCQITFGSYSANPLNYANVLYLNGSVVTELVIPDDITEIKDYAFFNCKSLSRVTLPEKIIKIGTKAFYNCINLSSVAIPGSMQTISEEAFGNCSAIEKVFFCDSPSSWEKIDIDSSNTYLINAPRDHDWRGYACALCGLERVDEKLVYFGTPGLSFQDYIGLQILFKNSTAKNYDRFYVEILQVTPDGVVSEISAGVPYKSSYTVFEQKIVSWSMTEKVTITLCGVKGNEVYKGASFTTSVMDLAMEKLVGYEINNELTSCRALVDMLNYGAAVQLTYNHNAENLPNADLGDFAVYGTEETPVIEGANCIEGSGSVKIYVNNISLQDKVEFQFMVKTSALADKTVKAMLKGEDVAVSYTPSGSYTIIRVAVAAAHMRDMYTIAILDAKGNPASAVYNVSVAAYTVEQLNSDRAPALIAMIKYGDSISRL